MRRAHFTTAHGPPLQFEILRKRDSPEPHPPGRWRSITAVQGALWHVVDAAYVILPGAAAATVELH